MIRLPPLSIHRNEIAEVRLVTAAREWLEQEDTKRAKGIHASGLLDPRLEYWRDMLPRPLTEKQTMLFLIGRVLHHFVISSVEPATAPGQSDSGSHEELGILFSPDLIKDGHPIEIKTNRSFYPPREDRLQDELSFYLEQLCLYLILSNSLTGELWILYLNIKDEANRTFPEMRCYSVELSESQFHDLEQQIVTTRDLLLKAKAKKDHRGLELCRKWLCGTNCVYFQNECRPEGRYPHKDKKKWLA